METSCRTARIRSPPSNDPKLGLDAVVGSLTHHSAVCQLRLAGQVEPETTDRSQTDGVSRRDFLNLAAPGTAAAAASFLAGSSTRPAVVAVGGLDAQTAELHRRSACRKVPVRSGASGTTFKVDLVTGSGSFSVPIAVSPGRSGFSPKLMLECGTGYGNGPLGLGWQLVCATDHQKDRDGPPEVHQ